MNDNPGREWWRPDLPTMAPGIHAGPEAGADGSRIAFGALMVFLFILLISPQSIFSFLAPLRIAMLAAAFAVLTHVLGRLREGKPAIEPAREIKIVMLLSMWAILTIPFSYWPGGSVSYLMEMFFKTLIVFWLIGSVVNTKVRLRYLCWGLGLMSIPLALSSVIGFFSGTLISEETGRVAGYNAPLTNNPNDLALMINLIIPLCIALFFSSRRPVIRLILMGIIGLNMLAVFTTFSRGGFLTLAVILLAYIWLPGKRPERGWAYLILLAGLMAIPFIPMDYSDRISTITDIEADESGSAQERFTDIVAATRLVIQNPIIGSGIGMNIFALNEARGETWTAIHNVYLQYAVELGLPGLVLFLMLLGTSYRNVSVIRHDFATGSKPDGFIYLAEGIRISLIAFMVAALFYPVAYHFYFYVVAGLAAAARSIAPPEVAADDLLSSPPVNYLAR